MTMATLSVQPVNITCILPLTTLPQPRLVSTESIASIRTTCTTSTTSFLRQSAVLRESPTTDPMTAAPSGVDDDERSQSDSSPVPSNQSPTAITPTFLQEWNEFYNEFINSSNYLRYVKPQHDIAAIAATDDKIAQPRSNHQSMTAATPMTLSQPCPSLKQSIPSIQANLPASNPLSLPHASPCDSPTMVHTTAAPSATDAEDLPWSTSSPLLSDDISDAEFLQKRNEFHPALVQSNQDSCNSNTTLATPVYDDDNDETTTQPWYTQQSAMITAPPTINTKPCPLSPEIKAMIQMQTTQTKPFSQPAQLRSSTPVTTTAINVAADDTQTQFTTAPSDEAITEITPTLLHERQESHKEFCQTDRNYQNDIPASILSAISDDADDEVVQPLHQQHSPTTNDTISTPIRLTFDSRHQGMTDDRDLAPHHNSAHTTHSTPIVDFGFTQLNASIDRLAAQQT